ncbi:MULTISPECIES: hypothetical protein [Bacillus]|uniref:hypothetical protein n=1 Tax=Bacillus TaxID=1386 RepID=UPI0013635D25|nr:MULTISPECIES: hypothetical protein [Bacillus]MBD0405834.1 hypothetical protein [Bacillus sp. 1021]MDK4255764.1 hypothetical protein [Bacillus velezensis]MEC2018577.1 hypothetical protein [Bacillus velezensis]MED3436595.1 hypothetical protein [Bacillus velezensis]QHK08404.1 hypothetical protein C7M19_03448 [Bacillus velezensis]
MIFKSNIDIYKNAYPNWQKTFRSHDEHLILYSNYFKESADKLISSYEGLNNHSIDSTIIPIIYLYRHSIELCLKAILYHAYIKRKLDKTKIQDKLNRHNLSPLWDMVTSELRKSYLFSKDNESKKVLRKLHVLIIELNNFDPYSIYFRYPFDQQLEENVYGDGKENFGIDYIHMKNEVNFLYEKLYYWIYDKVSKDNYV